MPRSLGININLIWGVVLLVFGVLMLLGAMRGKQNPAVGLKPFDFHLAGRLICPAIFIDS